MRQLSWWLEWPVGAIRVAVVFLVGVTLGAVVLEYPSVLRGAGNDASRNSSLSYADREIAGGNGLVADQLAVYEAKGRIPVGETYHVVVSPSYAHGSPETVEHVAGYYRYFLLPRRPAEDARWIVCYGCDTASYGARAEVIWEGDDEISIIRLRP
jgi:hypothetical protein